MQTISRREARRRLLCLTCLFIVVSGSSAFAEQLGSKIVSRPELGAAQRRELASKLRAITGWPELHFDAVGALRSGEMQPVGGSQTARTLLASAASGKNLIVIEDASGSSDVVFCRVIEGRWKDGAARKPPVFVVQIDFADFSHVMGDDVAREAFNVGWGTLHEIEHVVSDSVDAKGLGEAGECEVLINRMRGECGLAERAEYFYTLLPGVAQSDFKTRFVRLAFERRGENLKPKRYWLIWDAQQIGGLTDAGQVATNK